MTTTNKGRKIYICETAQPTALTQVQYEGLTWLEVKNVGSVGDAGTNTNVLSYNELGTEVAAKQKGVSNAGDPVIECARNPTDPGQVALRTMCLTKFIYALKIEDEDAPSASYTNTIYYNRGICAGPLRPGGGVEDFILERYTFGLVQLEIVVPPEANSAPTNILTPAISGVAQVGQVLTAWDGTWA